MKQITFSINNLRDVVATIGKIKAMLEFGRAKTVFAQVSFAHHDMKLAESILKIMKYELKGIKIAGICTDRELSKGKSGEGTTGISVMFFEEEDSAVDVLECDCNTVSAAEAASVLSARINEMDDVKAVALYMTTMTIDSPDDFMDCFAVKRGVHYIGFGSCGGFPPGSPPTFICTDHTITKGFVAVVFRGSRLEASTEWALGWKPMGREHMIETSDEADNVITKIDGRPAWELYYKYLGVEPDDRFVDNVWEFPLIAEVGGYQVARGVVWMDQNRNLVFPVNFVHGENARLSVGMMADILQSSESCALRQDNFGAQAVLIAVCGNRKRFLTDFRFDEKNFFLEVFPEMSGCISYGEITSIGPKLVMLNYTLLSLALKESTEKKTFLGMPNKKFSSYNRHYQMNDHSNILQDRMMKFIRRTSEEYAELRELEHERELREEVRVQKAANTAKSAFLSNMSHEIRTPINAILGMNEMILREVSDSDIREYAINIRNAGTQLLGLINDILDFSKVEAGKMEIIDGEYSMSSLLNDMFNMLSGKAEDKGLRFNIDADPNIPDVLYGDEMRVRQILTNIINNAIKYTREGSVLIKAGFKRPDQEHVDLEFHVKDTGIGIKDTDISKLTKPFERVEEERNKNIEGTGLGLSITTQLLDLMGSRLDVDSVYGQGSDFHFVLRQKVMSEDVIGNFSERARSTQAEKEPDREIFHAPKARILVVDDTPMNLTVVKNLLKRTQIQIDTAESGQRSVEMSAENHYDIIFMDHRMPIMDGTEAMKAIKALPEGNPNEHTPVIVLTANAVQGARETLLADGFDDYLSKPIDSAQLEDMIWKYLPFDLKHKHELNPDGTIGSEEIRADGTRVPASDEPLIPEIREAEESGAVIPQWIRDLEDLDADTGIMYCGGEENFLTVLRVFYESFDETYRIIDESFATKDRENYNIKVHALKSSARVIGALAISEQAKELEAKSDEGKVDEAYLMENTPLLLADYRKLQEALSPLGEAAGEDEGSAISEEDKPEIDEVMLKDAFMTIKEMCNSLDGDTVEMVLNVLDGYRLDPETGKAVKDIRTALTQFDWDAVAAISGGRL